MLIIKLYEYYNFILTRNSKIKLKTVRHKADGSKIFIANNTIISNSNKL